MLAFISSLVSGVLGVGGGTLLLAAAGLILPPFLLIPIHGLVQLSSNFSRALVHFKNIEKKVWLSFLIGALLGAYVGSHFLIQLPKEKFSVIIALGILILTWLPKLKLRIDFRGMFYSLGALTSFLSLFIGAVGPVLAPFFLHKSFTKEQIVATKASCQSVVHSLKVFIFFSAGFQLGEYLFIVLSVNGSCTLWKLGLGNSFYIEYLKKNSYLHFV